MARIRLSVDSVFSSN